jgi:cytochrome oxidase Cu insertion factor (SCO1/SenC/PrrC family)
MRTFVLAAVVCAGLMATTAAQTPAQTPPPPPELKVKAGDAAPAFELPGTDGTTHKLSDYKGKTVVLAWFPKAFTGG